MTEPRTTTLARVVVQDDRPVVEHVDPYKLKWTELKALVREASLWGVLLDDKDYGPILANPGRSDKIKQDKRDALIRFLFWYDRPDNPLYYIKEKGRQEYLDELDQGLLTYWKLARGPKQYPRFIASKKQDEEETQLKCQVSVDNARREEAEKRKQTEENLRNALAEARSSLATALKDRNLRENEDLQTVKKSLNECMLAKNELEKEDDKFENLYKKSVELAEEKSNQVEHLQEEVKRQEQATQSIKKELEACQEHAQEASERFQALTDANAKLKNKPDAQIIQEELRQCLVEKTKASTDLVGCRVSEQKLQQHEKELQTSYNHVNASLQRLQGDYSSSTVEYKKLSTLLDNYTDLQQKTLADIRKAKEKLADAEAKRELAESNLAASETSRRKVENEIAQLRKSASSGTELETIKKELAAAKKATEASINNLQRQAEERYNEAVSSCEPRIEKATTECLRSLETCSQIRKKLEKEANTVQTVRNELALARQALKDEKNQNETVSASLKKSFESCEKQRSQFADQLAAFKHQIETATNEAKEFQHDFEELKQLNDLCETEKHEIFLQGRKDAVEQINATIRQWSGEIKPKSFFNSFEMKSLFGTLESYCTAVEKDKGGKYLDELEQNGEKPWLTERGQASWNALLKEKEQLKELATKSGPELEYLNQQVQDLTSSNKELLNSASKLEKANKELEKANKDLEIENNAVKATNASFLSRVPRNGGGSAHQRRK